MEWGSSSFIEFHVPQGSDIFAQTSDQNIDVDQVRVGGWTNSIGLGSSAKFCHACVSGGTRYGDTCWGLTTASDTNRGCGCNSGGWAGNGIYYGGYKTPDVCGGQGGGFAGPKQTGEAKGNLGSIGLRILVAPERDAGKGQRDQQNVRDLQLHQDSFAAPAAAAVAADTVDAPPPVLCALTCSVLCALSYQTTPSVENA